MVCILSLFENRDMQLAQRVYEALGFMVASGLTFEHRIISFIRLLTQGGRQVDMDFSIDVERERKIVQAESR